MLAAPFGFTLLDTELDTWKVGILEGASGSPLFKGELMLVGPFGFMLFNT
jgi:hypothetical protein